MLTDGHYRLHRSTFAHPVVGIARPLRFALWQWMIGSAYFRESGDLVRGQFKATNSELAAVVGMKLSTLKTFKSDLVSAGMVSVERPTSKRAPSVWTVCNYDVFQAKASDPSPDLSPDLRATINPTHAEAAGTQESGDSESSTRPISRPIGNQQSRHLKKEKLQKENSRKKTLEDPPKPPKGGGPLIDEKGNKWPMVPKKGKVSYSEPFNQIWQQWLDGQKAKPDAISATDKANAYTLVREHVADGTATPDEIYIATRNYIRLYTSGRKKVGAYHPSRFYRRKAPTFLDHIGTIGTGTTESPTGITDRWHNPRDAWRECASLSTHLGLELPDVPKRTYGAEWEDVEKFHPLIVEFATDRSGFKEVPDDLAARIQGGE